MLKPSQDSRIGCHARTGIGARATELPSPVPARTGLVLGMALIWPAAWPGTVAGRQERCPARRGDTLLTGWPVLLVGSRYPTWRQLRASNMTNQALTYLSPPGRARRPLGGPVHAGQEHRGGRRNRRASGAVAATGMTPRDPACDRPPHVTCG